MEQNEQNSKLAIIEVIKKEINEAITNNYDVLIVRLLHLYDTGREEGEFEARVRGKIDALEDILHFIEEQEMLIKED